ncbi:MAG: trypsin-like peptidase domain-containing protein [Verrucomicrobiota bacterium]
MWRALFLTALAVCLFQSLNASDALGLERRMVAVFQENHERVVRIKAAYEDKENGSQVSLRVGTGFFVSSEGLILANTSVTEGARRIWIERGDASLIAEVIGSDAETNIALLKVVDPPESGFSFIPVDKQPYPEVGTLLLSIGCALEFDPAPRMGLVSGRDSNFGQRVFPTSYIRTTIPANPGEGGSPVLDLNGRLLGMIVASLPEVGASYVIPASAIGKVRDDLLLSGSVQYGWIGMEVESRSLSADSDSPLVITSVVESGPASVSGLEIEDRIVSINGEGVSDINTMRHLFFSSRIGQFLDFRVKRDGEILDLEVQVSERPSVTDV